jgi:hypothetical protein
MAKPRPQKKGDRRADEQPPLASPQSATPATGTSRVLPMHLQVGDHFSDEKGEWEIMTRPHTTGDGKVVHASVRKVGQPAEEEERTWRAHEHVAVKRG